MHAGMRLYLPKIIAVVILAAIAAPNSWALLEIAIANTQTLSFGSFVAGNGGSVAVSTSGARNASGDVYLIPSSEGTAAQFTVSGDPDATYTIQLPGNNFVKLTGPGADMVINDVVSSPSGAGGQLGGSGSQTLSVGGELSVGSGQTPGNYSGSLTVTVNYN